MKGKNTAFAFKDCYVSIKRDVEENQPGQVVEGNIQERCIERLKDRGSLRPARTAANILLITSLLRPWRGAKYCDLHVCLSVRLSQKPHVQTSRNFPSIHAVAVARSSSDDSAIRYVLPVL